MILLLSECWDTELHKLPISVMHANTILHSDMLMTFTHYVAFISVDWL